MSDLPVISNASPLIALAQIDHLDLMKQLFQTIVIPPTLEGCESNIGSITLPSGQNAISRLFDMLLMNYKSLKLRNISE